jgi:molybdopterin-dependent oxidoreductase alpha subunit
VLCVNTLEEPGMARYWIPSTPESAVFGTKITDRFFRVGTGGDMAFFRAVQRVLIERGAVDQAFLDAHTEGWDAYRESVLAEPLESLIARSGARPEDVVGLADELARARSAVLVWSMGLTQHGHGTATVDALLALGLSRGFVGREKCGFMPIRGHSGVQGGAEMGAYANMFPGAQAIAEESAAALEGRWGFRPPARVGLDAASMIEAAGAGGLDVFYCIGGNLMDTLPQPRRVEAALARVPVRIHQDIVLTHAMLVMPEDLVYLLPARTRYEHRGGTTETSTERRVIFSPHIPGHDIAEAREEWWIALALARAAHPERAHLLDLEDAAAIRREIAEVIPSYRGIGALSKQGDQFQWGGPRLCEGGVFPLSGGKARLHVTTLPDRALAAGEFHLSTRRGRQFNSMVHAEIDGLTGAARDHVLMSPEDMTNLGLEQDAPIVLENAQGHFRGRAFRAPMTPGNLQMHWPEANVLIAAGKLDPGGLVPDYNAIVRVRVPEGRSRRLLP